MSDNIKVVVKVRPLISREIEEKLSYQWRVKNNTLYQLDSNLRDFAQSFTFDKVYDEDTKTSDVYNDIAKPIVEAATAGFNGTIFAYGQTSSGKTYTMTGTEKSPGIIPLAVLNLFEIIKNIPDRDFLVRVSYIEIYNETLKDLLNVDKDNIKIHETIQGIKVDATEKPTSSPEEVLEVMKEGEANRQTGATNMNEKSSRSHSIFQITIESREHIEGEEEAGSVNVSQLNLVDLAGSERAGQTGATGIRFKEGTHINKSLSALALVIKQLSEDPKKFANYRDSKLTRILQNSLGGNAKTSIICAVTPAALEETISTLQFANRAKAIKNRPEVNAVATDATMIQRLTKQLSKLQSKLESKKNLEQDNYNLQKQIVSMQRLILNGFGQTRSEDIIGGARRKLQQPRRKTISTLHSIEEDTVTNVPKFCTPIVKYNPMLIPSASDFVPIQNLSKLASLPEEPSSRLVTPPPNDKKVNFNPEVIQIDSDDDDYPNTQTCSPYHKCYVSSKTPPCILRKNAKQAEKDLKDIVKLTEREKIYTPSVIELLEKQEKDASVIARLQDEVESLNKISKEKELEMNELKNKIKQTEEEVRNVTSAKLELETRCDDYKTKITDWEVIHETLKNKARLREEELLSLLEEQKLDTKSVDIGEIPQKLLEKEITHFMDMSKDLSLVNSDNESSDVIPNDDEPSVQIQELITEMQKQLTFRNETIVELEANLEGQKQRIVSLENSSQELQDMVNSCKVNVSCLENENSLLKMTVDSLNSTIKSQKQNLETAQNDMASYNSVIQELQIKLTQKENILNVNLISDSALENMIANEQKFIANNENMKNIIHSFRTVLDTRNKEINDLKSTLHNKDKSTAETNLREKLDAKKKDIEILNVEVHKLKEQVKENVTTINKLIREKSNLAVLEQELTNKFTNIEEKCNELEKLNEQYTTCIQNLKENNENLTHNLADKNKKEQEYSNVQEDLLKKIENLTNKIIGLEQDINIKENLICSLKEEEHDTQDNLLKAKTAINKLHNIFCILTGDIQEIPEIIDNFVTIFTIMSDNLNSIENIAINIMEQKSIAVKNNFEIKEELEEVINNHKIELSALHLQIENHVNNENNFIVERNNLSEKITQMSNDLSKLRKEVDQKTEENFNLSTILKTAEEHKKNIISSITEKECEFTSTIENLKKEIDGLNALLQSKQDNIDNLTLKLTELENTLRDKCVEITMIDQKLIAAKEVRDQVIGTIFRRVCDLTDLFYIENSLSCAIDDSNGNTGERILVTLDKIANHITLINSKNENTDNDFDIILSEAKKEIRVLTQENLELINKLSRIENENLTLSRELENNLSDHRSVSGDLTISQELLVQLQEELKEKATEIDKMEIKAIEWRDQFMELDILMKRQMQELQSENDKLKKRGIELRNDTKLQIDHFSDPEINDAVVNRDSVIRTVTNLNSNVEIKSPQSLLTICCDKIVQFIQTKDNDSSSLTLSSTDLNYLPHNSDYQTKNCMCNQFSLDLKDAQDENLKLMEILERLELVNQGLIKEQEEVRKEIQLLLEPAQELQKKIASHKTNLSILTATTYAENKSLTSQVKGLQHHHSRFHTVCQRDIPAFRMQLNELMTILKGDASIADTQNANFKRFSLPDVLDSNSTLPIFKNESTLDGDLLMLDTNVTLTTSADNTLLACNQTCLDLTQVMFNDASSQTTEPIQTIAPNIAYSLREILQNDNQNIYETLIRLNEENHKLWEQINNYSKRKEDKVDAQSSPIKVHGSNENFEYVQCQKDNKKQYEKESLDKELQILSQELLEVKSQKQDFEIKYNNLLLEVPTTDALVRKLSTLEKKYNCKANELSKLSKILDTKNGELILLLEENNSLSTQVMENISEADDLNLEIDRLKKINVELTDKCFELNKITKESKDQSNSNYCSQCIVKDELIRSLQNKHISKNHSKLNRSFSDSDTASRYNKICTLQNELHAGREDCKELTEEVETIKNHLESSNLSMDLDENSDECKMPDIAEERPLDIYMIEKFDCFNFYVENTGIQKEALDRDMKIIDLMKRFYNNIIIKHGNEVENLVNKLRDQEELKVQLQTQITNMTAEYFDINEELKELKAKKNTKVLSDIKRNIDILDKETTSAMNTDTNTKIVNIFKETVLKVLDTELELSSVKIFEFIIENIFNKHKKDLTFIVEQYTKLQNHMESLTTELNSVNDNLAQMKIQLSEKEAEYNLLKAQKERIHEISNAVTLDIIKKEQDLNNIITKGCQKLTELKIINPGDINLMGPFNENVKLLIEYLINQYENTIEKENEKDKLIEELENSKIIINGIQKDLEELKMQNKDLQDENTKIYFDMLDKENKLQKVIALNEEFKSIHERKVKENATNLSLIEKLTEEVKILKDINLKHETEMLTLPEKENKITELLNTIRRLQEDSDHLKSVNNMILQENESYATALEKSEATIRGNNIELDRLTSDILILRESVKENTAIIDDLKQEAKTLLQENIQLKGKFEEKSRDCARLETNIKTHEKTAEVQSRMIIRLQKQKDEDDTEKRKKLEELLEKCSALQKECEGMQYTIEASKCEIDQLKDTKESLETHVSELEAALEASHKPRLSIDAIADTSRRRRQSIYDSKRLFAEDKHDFDEHANLEAVFDERSKPDLFMDIDEDASNRSSPIGLGRGRDSLLSRTDQSDKDEEHPSRAGSVVATRRRRQSTHDLHRSVTRHTPSPSPSPHDHPSHKLIDELDVKLFKTSGSNAIDSEMSLLRDRLASCQQELEDLKEKYRELDDECEICAEYLRERDEQCLRLKREKKTLEHLVTELKEKLQSCNLTKPHQVSKTSIADASVNTDEDWTNLHAVVVDRMSYDAEVEKNKRYTKIIEELRFKKQELKNMISKMQKALEKNSAKDNKELEATKQELRSCKLELEDLKAKYKELDEECEMCAEYLKERDEQCRKLKEAKSVLEAKLQKIQEDSGSITHSVRKKRQNVHDMNRGSASDASDAFTETSEDFLSHQVERDDSSLKSVEDTQFREIKCLKMTIEKLSQQKAALEQQLKSGPMSAPAPQPMFVATGSAIVQNQQLTDVMKENQRLKKINAKLVNICKKRGKCSEANRENEDPAERG